MIMINARLSLLILDMCIFSLFLLVSLAQDLSVFLILSKKKKKIIWFYLFFSIDYFDSLFLIITARILFFLPFVCFGSS